ncbi:MAG: serine hydrolase [Pseudomonadota bacterium]
MAGTLFAAAVTSIAAPYLPRLLIERYPQPRWPAPGYFLKLNGAPASRKISPVGHLDRHSRELFETGDGRALLIFQGRKLHVAHYSKGVTPETKFNSYSLAKSLIGALLLKAIAERKLESLDTAISQYLSDAGDIQFRSTSVRDFARMRSGIAFKPDKIKSTAGPVPKDARRYILNPFGPMAQLHMRGIEPLLSDLRLDQEKLDKFSYQNANTAILATILERAYGKPLQALVSEKIWRPAGAADAHWRRYSATGPVTPYCCIYATPADWLRVGLFLMRNGSQEQPFLPRKLWELYFGEHVSTAKRHDGYYGIHVYQNVLDLPGNHLKGRFTFMFGSRGQVVYMMPERELVVVRFGDRVQRLHSTLRAAWTSVPLNH